MKTLRLVFGIALACLVSGCSEPAVNLSSPHHFDQNGLAFDYPSNWKITDNEDSAELRYIIIESPGDAIVIFQIYGLENDMSLQEYGRAFSESAKEETPMGTFSNPVFRPLGYGDGIEEKFNITVLNQAVPHHRSYLKYQFDGKVCYLIFQVAEEDFEKTKQGFKMIVDSLSLTET